MELLYGGEQESFSSLRAKGSQSTILNLEQGDAVTRWGRLIFHVADVDALWAYLRERGFHAERPRDASWGERYFHMPDPDGHELSFARPIRRHVQAYVLLNDYDAGQCSFVPALGPRNLRGSSVLWAKGPKNHCFQGGRRVTLCGAGQLFDPTPSRTAG